MSEREPGPNMDDLIEIAKRLDNATIRFASETEDQAKARRNQVIKDAATALRASADREKELVEALKPFAKFAAYFEEKAALRPNQDTDPVYGVATMKLGELELNVGDFRKAARAILSKHKEQK